ncbi:MAG: hypothetical protein JKY96_03100 [Phycisphaerales bacterium]|nr:hypothetical protein [Phycisphaerales bacterium]
MSSLGYALDGLYSAGWWPGEGDRCIQSADGRWMPEPSKIIELFAESGYQIRISSCEQSTRCRVEWSKWGGIHGSAVGRSRDEALLIGYTELIRVGTSAGCIG